MGKISAIKIEYRPVTPAEAEVGVWATLLPSNLIKYFDWEEHGFSLMDRVWVEKFSETTCFISPCQGADAVVVSYFEVGIKVY